jgi:hypothetical protein
VRNSRWNLGSVQSKAISLLTLALIILSPVQPAFAAFGDGSPTITNPSVFTSADAPKVDGPTGAFTQSVSLDIPPGRNGLQPDVSLQYNSQNTSDGIVGYGWSLSIPYIQRLNKTGSQNLYASSSYFTSSTDGELAFDGVNTPAVVPAISPTIMDTLNLPSHTTLCGITSDSFSYTVPSGGANKLLLVLVRKNFEAHAPSSATLNGVSLAAFTRTPGTVNRGILWYSYLTAPTSGTFQINFPESTCYDIVLMTVQNAAQTSPIDAALTTYSPSASSMTTSATTTQGYDLLVGLGARTGSVFTSYGAGATEITNYNSTVFGDYIGGSWKAAASTPGLESVTGTGSGSSDFEWAMVAVKGPNSPAMVSTTTTYRARIDGGSHNSYSFATSSNTWTVYDKNGTRYLYGSSDSGRQYDINASTSTNTYKWMLQEVRDTNDNYIKYTYNRDNNQLYPYKITYTGRGSTDGISSITFATSTRPDTRVSYASGFAATTTKLISEVDALVNGTTVRKYLLGYGTGNNGYRSLLTSVQQQGYDDSGNLTSLPATTFGYTSSSTQFYGPSRDISSWGQSYVIADTNGNGINDVSAFYFDTNTLSNHSNIEVDNSSYVTSYVPPDYWANAPGSPLSPQERGVRFVDVNGDGKPDVVKSYYNYTSGATSTARYINGYSGGSFSWAASTTWTGSIPYFDFDGSGSVHNDTTGIFGDVNGDGLPDYEQYLSGEVGPAAYVGNGSAWDSTSNFAPVSGFPVFGPNSLGQQLIDVNGDGLDDWVESGGVYLNNGTGWQSLADTHWSIGTSTLYASPSGGYYDRGIRFIDMNGDGLPDYVRSYNVGNDAGCTDLTYGELASVHAVYLNTGNGWATTTSPYALPADILYAHDTNFGGGACIWNDGGRGPRFDEYGNWYGNGQMAQDVLTNVTNSKGGKTSVIPIPQRLESRLWRRASDDKD